MLQPFFRKNSFFSVGLRNFLPFCCRRCQDFFLHTDSCFPFFLSPPSVSEGKKKEKKLTAAEGKQGVVVDGGRCGNRENCWLERGKKKNQRLVLPNFRDGKKLAPKELGECRGIVAEREKNRSVIALTEKVFLFPCIHYRLDKQPQREKKKRSCCYELACVVCYVWYWKPQLEGGGRVLRATKNQKLPFPLHSLTNI